MQVTIAPASTKTGAAVIRSLLSQNQDIQIRALYRDVNKAPAEFTAHDNFTPVKADVSDASSLDFAGSDAVLAITPPVYDGRDVAKHAELVSRNVKDAIERAGCVKRLVLLSSMGAQFDHGVGEIKTNHTAETVFQSTDVPEIVFVRCAYFMENWTMSLDTLKAPEPFFFSTITPLDWKVAMVATKDIGSTLATELTKTEQPPSKPHVFELHGPRSYTPLDVKEAFSEALGREVVVKPVEKDELEGFYGQVFPKEVVGEYVEMTLSFLAGGVAERDPDEVREGIVRGKTELGEVLGEAVAGLRGA